MKRAAAQIFWVLMIAGITIIGLLFTVNLFGKTKELSKDLTDYEICRDGNYGVAHSKFKVFDWVVAEQGVKHCRTEQVPVPKGKEYETITKKMVICWDEYLQGKEPVFETKDNNYCAFCSVLEFEDKDQKLSGLSAYLASNKPLGSGKTYLNYLSEIDTQGDQLAQFENLELSNNVFIDTSKKLAIMFVMYKDAYPGLSNQPRTKLSIISGAGGAVVGAGLGLYYLGSAALCLTVIGCAASISLITLGTGVGATSGFLIGSDRTEDRRARLLVTEYNKEKLKQIKCTQLEGYDYLKIQK